MTTQVSQTEEPRVLYGSLIDPYTFLGKDGEEVSIPEGSFDGRAMWSWLRFNHGGKQIDQTIKDTIEAKRKQVFDEEGIQLPKRNAITYVWGDLYGLPREMDRTLQYIFRDSRLMAVATDKHLLIEPSQVYEIVEQVSKESRLSSEMSDDLFGTIINVNREGGIHYGFQVDAGSITTRNAIRVASTFRVQDCMNPLSWLGVGNFRRFGLDNTRSLDKILRIKKISELRPRIKQAIEAGVENIAIIKNMVEDAKKKRVDARTAKILMSALGVSYGLGAGTIRQVLNKYESEPRSLYGLSMASSWIARHKEKEKGRTDMGRTVPQSLATISAATLMMDPKRDRKKCLDWLKAKVEKGTIKSVADLIEEITQKRG